jgi:tripartite-type tricarboxylate transporter receptor subunit TctC
LNRRDVITGLAGSAALSPLIGRAAWAQAPWPSRNITMIVPFPPGGQADLAASAIARRFARLRECGKPAAISTRRSSSGFVQADSARLIEAVRKIGKVE